MVSKKILNTATGILLAWNLSVAAPAFADSASTCGGKGPNVVLFTWDGVRNFEFFRGTGPLHYKKLKPEERGTLLPKFWSEHAPAGMVLGGWGRYRIASSIAISLPSYQALLAGHPTDCEGNSCGRIRETTVLEGVREALGLEKREVAVFASWEGIGNAVERDPGGITRAIFPEWLDDGTGDAELDRLQRLGMEDRPAWGGSRKDEYTFRLGLHYLRKHCPRFLYISLVDSDEYGHQRDYPGYARSLRTYDGYLDELIRTLDSLGEYGKNTTLLLTTDHSRGPGPLWGGHATTKFSEKSVFLYARGRGVPPVGRTRGIGGHERIRPTIEHLFGLPPSGRVLPGIRVSPASGL